jgi:hypothetical protein
MLNVTNLFEHDLVSHFIQRFGDVVDRFEPRATLFGVEREKIDLTGETTAGSSGPPNVESPKGEAGAAEPPARSPAD